MCYKLTYNKNINDWPKIKTYQYENSKILKLPSTKTHSEIHWQNLHSGHGTLDHK